MQEHTDTQPKEPKNKPQRINVEINGHTISLTINDLWSEEVARSAAKNINNEINKLKKQYFASDMEYTIMAALAIAIENNNNKQKILNHSNNDTIINLNNKINDFFEK